LKTSTSTALAALVAVAIGMTGLVSAASAQDAAPASPTPQATQSQAAPAPQRDNGRRAGHGQMRRGMMQGGLLNLVCSARGAEALDVYFVRLSHRLQLTGTQQPLFDALRTKALTTQTNFADTCQAARPAKTAAAKPDMLTLLKSRLAVDTARLTAMNDVLPDFEAFYASLTDTQKAGLLPHGGMHRMHRPGGQGFGMNRNG
jgi:hypothetical protein